MTQIEYAKSGRISADMRRVAKSEKVPLEKIVSGVADGRIVIVRNKKRTIKACAIGEGLTTKVNANIGTSEDRMGPKEELSKLRAAVKYGADTVMDLSTGGDLRKFRRMIIKNSGVPVGTVPIYQAAVKAAKKNHFSTMTKRDIMDAFEEQAEDGVDFFTVHCGVTLSALERLKNKKRVAHIVSRGGAFLAGWMILNKKENPLYESFDEIIKISKKYDITLSLGDGMRPGSLADATDRAQVQELISLGELADKARKSGVQVIIEGPGHMPLDQIEANVLLQKKLCGNAPFYVLGPLVTDVAPGYDHIVGAIGGALAASHGADFLCYVTPSEHLRIPDKEDIKEGVIASRIAAHAADIAKKVPGAMDWDRKFSGYRYKRNWEEQVKNSLDPEKTQKYRKSARSGKKDVCTMCSEYCSMKITERYFK